MDTLLHLGHDQAVFALIHCLFHEERFLSDAHVTFVSNRVLHRARQRSLTA